MTSWPGMERPQDALVQSLNPRARHEEPAAVVEEVDATVYPAVSYGEAPTGGFTDPRRAAHISRAAAAPESEDLARASEPQSLAERLEALQAPVPAGKPLPAQEGWRAGLSKLTGGLLKLAPGKTEAQSREHVAAIQRVFPRPVTIMVANPGGGEGKSPTALALGATFGSRSEHAVLAWDNNETMGTLAALAQSDGSTQTVTDLLEALPSLSHAGVRAGDVRAFTRHQGNSRFSVLTSHHDPARMQMITRENFSSILETVQRFWNLTILDTGNNTIAPNWLAALDVADQLVIPMHLTGKGQRSVLQMIQQLDTLTATTSNLRYRELYERAVVILVPGRTSDAKAARLMRGQLVQIFGPSATFIDAPFEPQLASGSTVDWAQARPATVRAYEKIAAAVADGANTWAKTHH